MRELIEGAVFFNELNDTAKIAFKDVCKNKNYATDKYYSMMHFLYLNSASADDDIASVKLLENMFKESLNNLSDSEKKHAEVSTHLSEVTGFPFIFFYENLDGTEDRRRRLMTFAALVSSGVPTSANSALSAICEMAGFNMHGLAMTTGVKSYEEIFTDDIQIEFEIDDKNVGLHFYNMIPSEHIDKFVEEFISHNSSRFLTEYNERTFTSFYDYIAKAFVFSESQQGHKFWIELIKRVIKEQYGKE